MLINEIKLVMLVLGAIIYLFFALLAKIAVANKKKLKLFLQDLQKTGKTLEAHLAILLFRKPAGSLNNSCTYSSLLYYGSTLETNS